MLCSESFAPKALAISPPVLAQRRGAVGDLLGFGPVAIHFGGQALDLLGSRRSRGVELRHGSVRRVSTRGAEANSAAMSWNGRIANDHSLALH